MRIGTALQMVPASAKTKVLGLRREVGLRFLGQKDAGQRDFDREMGSSRPPANAWPVPQPSRNASRSQARNASMPAVGGRDFRLVSQ